MLHNHIFVFAVLHGMGHSKFRSPLFILSEKGNEGVTSVDQLIRTPQTSEQFNIGRMLDFTFYPHFCSHPFSDSNLVFVLLQ